MKKLIIVIVIFQLFTLASLSEEVERKNYFPIWTFHQGNINIYGISVGFLSFPRELSNTKTNGIRLELIGSGLILPFARSFFFTGNDSVVSRLEVPTRAETISGLSLSPLGTVCNCYTSGISISGIGQYNFQVNGISSSLLINFAAIHNGIQIAAFNQTYISNGLQLGIANYSSEVKGIQIGIWNITTVLNGIQIGFWNVSDERSLPFINWNF